MSNYSFVTDPILAANLNQASDHILDLLSISELSTYRRKTKLVSSLRKTIIILTGSIVEAILLWQIKLRIRSKVVELEDEWSYVDQRVLHQISPSQEIVAGKRQLEKMRVDKLDLKRCISLCRKYGLITENQLADDIDRLRVVRNRLHLGALAELERQYSVSDLEFCFGVTKRVRELFIAN